MRNTVLLSILLSSALLADTSLGEKISVAPAQERIVNESLSTTNSSQIDNNQTQSHLTTRVSPSNIKKAFREDHHRYDKRYANFDYENQGYYNDDGYYYGYYDNHGYFYNNIYFTYNNLYTYDDRCHRRGHFDHGYHHRRYYRYHRMNDWNRVHCYREPNVIVVGNYYDRSYYPRTRYYNDPYRSNYYGSPYTHYPRPARMNVTRMNGRNNTNHNYHSYRNSYYNHGNARMNVTRMQNNSRSYSHNSSHRSSMQRRSTTRMSSSRNSTGRHMGMPR